MEALTILSTVLFSIAVTGLVFGVIILIAPTVKKIVINLSALTLILAVLFINLVQDIARAVKYVTIG